MTIRKVVIFNGYGDSGFPNHIQRQIKEKIFPANRCGSIIEILENFPNFEGEGGFVDRYKKLMPDEVLRAGNDFYFGAKPYNISCKIVEVDISKKWRITEYDGAEGIEYLDFKCISKELNYWDK